MGEVEGILEAIATYASAYDGLRKWQETSSLIPRGDQKTGCIGEFYVRLYLRARFPGATFKYGSLSEKGWDVDVSFPGRTWKIQVKAVSAFAVKRRLSPIHNGWHELAQHLNMPKAAVEQWRRNWHNGKEPRLNSRLETGRGAPRVSSAYDLVVFLERYGNHI
jgi:hypothetical protein